MEGLNNVLTHGTINMGLINLSSQNGSINSLGRSTTSKEDHCFKEMSPWISNIFDIYKVSIYIYIYIYIYTYIYQHISQIL